MAQLTVPRTRKLVVAMKPETTAGSDIFAGTYVAADVIQAVSDSIRFTQDQTHIMNVMTAGQLGRLPAIPGAQLGRVEFTMYLRGKGAAYTASVRPEADLPLRACALGATLGGGAGTEKYTYQPSDTMETMTVYVVQFVSGTSALAAQLVGCLGTVRFSGRAGGLVQADFALTGALDERADITFVAGTLAGTPSYPTFKSSAFQIGTANYAPRIASVGFDLANQMQAIPSINAASGIAGWIIADREPRLTIDPEADLEANSAWWASLRDGTPLMDCTFQVGAAQYNRLKFQFTATAAAGLQVFEQSFGTRDGLTSVPTSLLATISTGNDDVALIFD